MSIEGAAELYLSFRAMKGSTQQTLADLKRYLADFSQWAKSQGVDGLRSIDADVLKQYQLSIFEYRKRDGHPLAPASKLAKLVPLRGWLRWLFAQGARPNLAEVIELPAADQALPRRLLSVAQIES